VKNKLIQPYLAGKNQKSVAMIIPASIVKAHEIDPSSVILLLRSDGFNDLKLKIIREQDLIEKEEAGKEIPAATGISL